MKNEYVVTVGNLGNITCKNKREATKTYNQYVRKSKSPFGGRVQNETVHLFVNSEVTREYFPPILLIGLPTKIKKYEDVRMFFKTLHDNEVSFHPDDDFNDYYPCFTKIEAKKLNLLMDQCHRVCYIESLDIYEVALEMIVESV